MRRSLLSTCQKRMLPFAAMSDLPMLINSLTQINLSMFSMYTCSGIVLAKSGSFKAVIERNFNADAAKHALFAMRNRCSDVLLGLLWVEGALSMLNTCLLCTVQTLRDDWAGSVCQSSGTKTSFYMDKMFSDSDRTAQYLTSLRPGAPCLPLSSSGQVLTPCGTLQIETVRRWLIPKPIREQHVMVLPWLCHDVCRHCKMQAIQNEQHYLFDCPVNSIHQDPIRAAAFLCLVQATKCLT